MGKGLICDYGVFSTLGMIISASRRTDIPAFYAKWFLNRLREGYLLVQNPFNAHKLSRVELTPDKVEAIVFWTKNPAPLLEHLKEIDSMGYKYYFQFTLTGYPKQIEPSVPCLDESTSSFRQLSEQIGAKRVVWRYDPIIISDITGEKYNLENFEKLAKVLSNYTKRVVISFADFYKKVVKNFDKVTKDEHIRFYDINLKLEQIERISISISNIARAHSLEILSCAEKLNLSHLGINHGKCIDDDLIRELFGTALNISKDRHQRDECGCVQSKDIGQYNTCTHDCLYCYANSDKDLARKNMAKHDPFKATLIGNGIPISVREEKQLNLL